MEWLPATLYRPNNIPFETFIFLWDTVQYYLFRVAYFFRRFVFLFTYVNVIPKYSVLLSEICFDL